MPPQIVLVRHGETEWSATGKHTSRTDLSLTEAGRERARALAPELAGWSFTRVVSSPLKRARETCELAGLGDAAELDDDLREWDYGEYEGLTTPEIREENPGWSLWRDGCPGGEMSDQVGERADRALARLRSADGDAVAFAHGHILRVLTGRWLGMPTAAGARFALAAGGVGELGFERETEVLRRWNA
jgi:probable phosphoglycerate mutase